MRKIVLIKTSLKSHKIGINTKGVTLCHHPNFAYGIRKLPRWMVWHEIVLKRKKVR